MCVCVCVCVCVDGIPSFPMDTMYLQAIRKRVNVARRLETTLHRKKKVCISNNLCRPKF